MGKILSAFVQTNSPFAAIVKGTAQSVNNSEVLVDDNELTKTLRANQEYAFECRIFINSSAVADFKYDFNVPAGATIEINEFAPDHDTDVTIIDATIDVTVTTGGTDSVIAFFGRITTGATVGNVTYRFAQNTAEVSNTTVQVGSSLIIWES